ncbi:MAG: hypothetical protein CMA16_01950 [Euryarchaeota archaeon]|nr:hypothetical protein [Euryarchaeota archaeon]|tara:strand:+ start:870 stop:1511 length:642 start_codon:yes stop_codon:yes gene_type:complete
MSQFEEGLPSHFVVFSQTPKAQEHGRALFLRFSIFLIVPVLGILVFGSFPVSLVVIGVFFLISGFSYQQWHDWQRTPFAVSPSHPMMELDSDKESEVMIRMHDGRWLKAGNDRYRLIKDDVLSGYNLVAINDDYTILGHFTDKKTLDANLRRTMALLNQSLALRDAHNEIEDEIEDARKRESIDYGLLDRDWPDESEMEDASGPIAKRLKRQE